LCFQILFDMTVAKFRERWNFSNVIGCIDGKHIRINCPTKKLGHCFTITNNFFSPQYYKVSRILKADSLHRWFWYTKWWWYISASTLYHSLEDFESTTLRTPATFEASGTEMPFVILGDEAYPLKTNLMKTFARKDLSCEESVFNYSLSRARRCVECAFGILTAKWRLINKATEANVNNAERTVRCICLLHIIIIYLEGTTHDHSVLQENFTNSWIPSGQNKCQR